MKCITTTLCMGIVLAGFALLMTGCAEYAGMTPAASGDPSSTLDKVCAITAKQMDVDRSRVTANTSLGDLGADELDFVEIVMELEDQFNTSIADERLLGSGDPEAGLRKITMTKLAGLVSGK